LARRRTLTPGPAINQIEAAANQNIPFNNFLVFPALLFHAEAVALVPKRGEGNHGDVYRLCAEG